MNRQQLAARIWRMANQMRSKIEASEYKDYILGFIFYRFLSQQEERFLRRNGWEDEDIAELSEENHKDIEYVQNNLGYFIAYKNLYSTWLKVGADFDIADVHDALAAFRRLVNPSYKALYDGIFTTLDTGLSKLGESTAKQTKAVADLIDLIAPIPMDEREDYDVLGYIYEYLISQFAANAGKKAGEFYTPHEVAILMSDIIAGHHDGKPEMDIYDPTSGSASLLLTIGQSVARKSGNPEAIHYYAQELKANTYNLTRMNLVMRGVRPSNITAKNADTLVDDWPMEEDVDGNETDKPLLVDACVSNPPYSQRWAPPTGPDPRFDGYGIAPAGKADYAFLLHNLYHLRRDGIMCIVLPHGVLFRGASEGDIRRKLLEAGNIYAVIGLPANIFYGTGIPTIVMVLKKVRTERDVLFIDGSKGFRKDGKKNQLRPRDIRHVVDAYETRETMPGFAKLATFEDIRANDYNLNIPRYVESGSDDEPLDLYSTMFGGIPETEIDALSTWWGVFPGLRAQLFHPVNGHTAELATNDIRATIYGNAEVQKYLDGFANVFRDYEAYLYEELVDEACTVYVPVEEDELARDLFGRLDSIPLVDKYEAYQVLDDCWQIISVDLEMIKSEGFESVCKVDPHMVLKKKGGNEVEMLDGWEGRILPFTLIQGCYLSDDMAAIKSDEVRIGTIDQELAEILESIDEDEKDSCDAINDTGDSFVASALKKAVKEISGCPSSNLDRSLMSAQKLLGEQSRLKRRLKQMRADLVDKTRSVIENLSDDDARSLLAEKWISPLMERLMRLPHDVVEDLIAKVGVLSEKYATTYADICDQIEDAEAELNGMLGQLCGDEFDMAGVAELRGFLGGEQYGR